MIKTQLSSKAKSILKDKGWNGLPRNIDRDLADLQEEEFDLPTSNALSFFQEFSGIEFEVIDEKVSTKTVINLGIEKALEIPCVKDDLSEHEQIVKKKFYPIGSLDLFNSEGSNYERMILLIAQDGMVYSSRSYVIVQEGYDAYDFINRIIDGNNLWKTDDSLRFNYSKDDLTLRGK